MNDGTVGIVDWQNGYSDFTLAHAVYSFVRFLIEAEHIFELAPKFTFAQPKHSSRNAITYFIKIPKSISFPSSANVATEETDFVFFITKFNI